MSTVDSLPPELLKCLLEDSRGLPLCTRICFEESLGLGAVRAPGFREHDNVVLGDGVLRAKSRSTKREKDHSEKVRTKKVY